MENNNAPNLLEEFFIVEKQGEVKYTPQLKFIFKHLIAEFSGLEYKDGNPNSLKTSGSSYISLAGQINSNIKNPGYIKGSYLANLCTGSNDNLIPPKEIRRLLIIFNFFKDYFKDSPKSVEYWIDELKKSEIVPNEYDPQIPGAKLINNNFKKSLLLKEQPNINTQFYLRKDEADAQWYGVFKDEGLDTRRKGYEEAKEKVIKSFETNKVFTISLIVCGTGGSGKSVVLRRLSADLIENNFLILWVDNLVSFNHSINFIKEDTSHKYLLIIEDWENQKGTPSITNSFLNETYDLANVRIVIGDRDAVNKEYEDYFDIEDMFELSLNENYKILNYVLDKNPQWVPVANKVLLKPDFIRSPIYIILFIIIKIYLDSNTENNFVPEENGIETKFKSIVRSDLKRINDKFPGLAISLYLWANIFIEYREFNPSITWEEFLKLADYHNPIEIIFKEFRYFDKRSPIGQVLSYYISTTLNHFPTVKIPYHDFNFHHDLLAELGVTQIIDKDWYSPKHINVNILQALSEQRQINAVNSLYFIFKLKEPNNKKLDQYVIKPDLNRLNFFNINFFNCVLKCTYLLAPWIKNEVFWKSILEKIALYTYYSYYNQTSIDKIFRRLIKNGCTDKLIKEYSQINRMGENQLIIKLFPKMKPIIKYTERYFYPKSLLRHQKY